MEIFYIAKYNLLYKVLLEPVSFHLLKRIADIVHRYEEIEPFGERRFLHQPVCRLDRSSGTARSSRKNEREISGYDIIVGELPTHPLFGRESIVIGYNFAEERSVNSITLVESASEDVH